MKAEGVTMTQHPAQAHPLPLTAFSAGVIVVRREAGGWRLLLLRAYRSWDFPKGGVEPGETPLAAALRETAEEAAVTDLAFRWGETYCETAPYRGGKVARYYLAETSQRAITLPVSPELGRPEHHEWRWVSVAEAGRLLPPRLQPILAWAAARLALAVPLALLPLGKVDAGAVARLAADLGQKGFDCSVLPAVPLPAEAADAARAQYAVGPLLEAARRAAGGRVLAVADVDLYARGYNYVFGMAEKAGRAAVMSLARLRHAEPARLRARMLKEAVHELGHTFGLGHCPHRPCVMHFSNTLEDTDRKMAEFCAACDARLAEQLPAG